VQLNTGIGISDEWLFVSLHPMRTMATEIHSTIQKYKVYPIDVSFHGEMSKYPSVASNLYGIAIQMGYLVMFPSASHLFNFLVSFGFFDWRTGVV
jgi:hypothetical protein